MRGQVMPELGDDDDEDEIEEDLEERDPPVERSVRIAARRLPDATKGGRAGHEPNLTPSTGSAHAEPCPPVAEGRAHVATLLRRREQAFRGAAGGSGAASNRARPRR